MQVRFWGTRGSIAVPGEKTAKYGGNTSCVEVRSDDGTLIILDCGTGVRDLGLHLLKSQEKRLRIHLLIGHTHWDHIQGFPFFTPAFLPHVELNIYAPLGFQRSVADALAGQMEFPYFPVTLRDLSSRIHFNELEEGFFRVGDVTVETQYINHTAPTVAYRISGGGTSIAYVTDHEPFWMPDDKGFHHPGDQRHIAFLKGADLVIHDAQYTNEEYRSKIGWGHSTIEYTSDIAMAAGVPRLALFHHDPGHDDATMARLEQMARDRVADRRGNVDVFAAAEGMQLTVQGNGFARTAAGVSAMRRRTIAGGRILVVSANEVEVSAIGKRLAEDDLMLVPVPDKRTALERAPEMSPDLAIIDSRLPDGDGVSLIQPLRACLGWEKLPIVMLMEGADLQAGVPEEGACAVDYLAKPYSPPMLHTRLRAWLDRARSEGESRPSQAGPAALNGASSPNSAASGARLADLLGKLPLFRSLGREQLLTLTARAVEQVYPPGHVVIRQDEIAEQLYVILSGRVRVVEAAQDTPFMERFLGEMGHGEIFGELGILIDQPRVASVLTVEHTRCLVLPQQDFLQVLKSSPELSYALLRVVAERHYHADRLLSRFAPDGLTGLAGRRTFQDQYRCLVAGARRHHSQVVLVLFDVVHLKAINDRYGYDTGDEVLRAMADVLTGGVGAKDLVARYGGDEFTVLLVDADQKGAEHLLNRAGEKFEEQITRRGLPPDVCYQSGMVLTVEPPDNADEIIWAADQNLRRKKGLRT